MFSYEDYREIIRIVKASGRACTYKEALTRDSWVIVRHDVEYSVDRAYALSKVEEGLDFHSTYFFQWTNNSYNVLSRKNRDILTDMHERGHQIGLHFALNGMTDMNRIHDQIEKEAAMLAEMLGFPIDAFSFHRPSPDVLAANMHFDHLLNAYQDDFFCFNPNTTPETVMEVKYLSDANHMWRYGYPDENNILNNKKVQILAHPFAWTKRGYDNLDNYKSLVLEKYAEMIDSIDNECKDFGALRDDFDGKLDLS